MKDDDIVKTVDLTRFERGALVTEVIDWIAKCDKHSRAKDAHPKWAQYRENWKSFLEKLKVEE